MKRQGQHRWRQALVAGVAALAALVGYQMLAPQTRVKGAAPRTANVTLPGVTPAMSLDPRVYAAGRSDEAKLAFSTTTTVTARPAGGQDAAIVHHGPVRFDGVITRETTDSR